MSELPKDILEAAEKVAKDLMVGKGTVYPDPDDLFKYGVQWLYSHLLDKAARGLSEHLPSEAGFEDETDNCAWFKGAKYMRAVDLALLSIKDAEIAGLKKQIETMKYMEGK